MSDGAAVHDILVVGGGPSGAACAYWLAEAGHDVLLVEKKHFPREKTCGDGLTPRAVRELEGMGRIAGNLQVQPSNLDQTTSGESPVFPYEPFEQSVYPRPRS